MSSSVFGRVCDGPSVCVYGCFVVLVCFCLCLLCVGLSACSFVR